MSKIKIPINHRPIVRKLPSTETNFVPNEEVQVCHSDVLTLIFYTNTIEYLYKHENTNKTSI